MYASTSTLQPQTSIPLEATVDGVEKQRFIPDLVKPYWNMEICQRNLEALEPAEKARDVRLCRSAPKDGALGRQGLQFLGRDRL